MPTPVDTLVTVTRWNHVVLLVLVVWFLLVVCGVLREGRAVMCAIVDLSVKSVNECQNDFRMC